MIRDPGVRILRSVLSGAISLTLQSLDNDVLPSYNDVLPTYNVNGTPDRYGSTISRRVWQDDIEQQIEHGVPRDPDGLAAGVASKIRRKKSEGSY